MFSNSLIQLWTVDFEVFTLYLWLTSLEVSDRVLPEWYSFRASMITAGLYVLPGKGLCTKRFPQLLQWYCCLLPLFVSLFPHLTIKIESHPGHFMISWSLIYGSRTGGRTVYKPFIPVAYLTDLVY